MRKLAALAILGASVLLAGCYDVTTAGSAHVALTDQGAEKTVDVVRINRITGETCVTRVADIYARTEVWSCARDRK